MSEKIVEIKPRISLMVPANLRNKVLSKEFFVEKKTVKKKNISLKTNKHWWWMQKRV
ncbi:hypothetical protein [Thermotoga sp.]|uniref:hypothetical protein n=1 Tax=Thermotoga sp. TaxID=28240 RepID=UPI0025D093EE|nr:hypothetical protein [Thermotoga sp.]MCD6551408.1 hypothetical protein [Thermotoga sp.]